MLKNIIGQKVFKCIKQVYTKYKFYGVWLYELRINKRVMTLNAEIYNFMDNQNILMSINVLVILKLHNFIIKTVKRNKFD